MKRIIPMLLIILISPFVCFGDWKVEPIEIDKGFLELAERVYIGDLEYVKNKIKSGYDVNYVWDKTLLIYAVMGNQEDTIRFLVDSGAQINADSNGLTALHFASGPLPKQKYYLFEEPYLLNTKASTVRLLLSLGADVNARGDQGYCPLMLSVLDNNTEIVRVLLAAGAELNQRNNKGRTALMLSVLNRNIDLTEKLLRAGANSNQQDNMGKTALILAVLGHDVDMVKLLLKSATDLDAKESKDRTALIHSVVYCNDKITKLLIEAGANVNVKDEYGVTPLIYAAAGGSILFYSQFEVNPSYLEIVSMLLESGADVNIGDSKGRTALWWARQRDGNKEIINVLKHAGAKTFNRVQK